MGKCEPRCAAPDSPVRSKLNFYRRSGDPLTPQPCRSRQRPSFVFDKSGGLHDGQYLRWVSLAEPSIRRHAIDRDRRPKQQRRRPNRKGPSQPASHAIRVQHAVLSQHDVERSLRRESQATRSITHWDSSFLFPREQRGSQPNDPIVTHLSIAQSAHAADRTGRGRGIHLYGRDHCRRIRSVR